ncbi:hypothetical protein DXT99_12680 [Pontibacter diazotrophicus]|uniref:Uncharacterized protein n=1 Tax=Pontibacter diazotrophicus TaxID=1400979 RepID=A0A3D8LBP3_9BACT|nr:hypothetical protein [Pontibacter diazotrophicus]RDV14815.1 hypothetical protein DXT99_12680 [Pontibacter diazotrophicus]
MRKALLLLVVLAGFIAGCEDKYKDPDPQAMGYGYYPLEVGDYRIYNVTDIRYRHDVGDTSRFQLRERVDTTFYDQTNTHSYKIVRSTRPDEGSAWVEDSVFVVAKQPTMLTLTKDNTKYVKLVFPVKGGVSWLGDAFNDRIADSYTPGERRADYYESKESYTYQSKGEPFTFNGQSYPNTVTVIQGTPTESWIGYDNRREIYAEDIGMVYRLYTRIVYCNDTDSDDCEYAIGYKLQGHERHEELISYGNE